MRIYVAGPYSASKGATQEEAQRQIDQNIANADNYARQLVILGHTPFVPHTMMRNWEDAKEVNRREIERICNEWVAQCDALLFLGPSPGANVERAVAESRGLPIFTPEKMPPAKALDTPTPEELREVRLVEYSECADSYRHTYQTIWSAGAVFFATSAGVLTFLSHGAATLTAAAWFLALLPIWFWYVAIFRPMDRYGNLRRKRLAKIEKKLNDIMPTLGMCHFLDEDIQGGKAWWVIIRDFIPKPRVRWYVNFLGIGITVYLLVFLTCRLAKPHVSAGWWVNWVS